LHPRAGTRVVDEEFQHVVNESPKRAIRDFAEECRMRRRPQERGPVCVLDHLNAWLRLEIAAGIGSGSEMMPAASACEL
jgi:hypothetical protein